MQDQVNGADQTGAMQGMYNAQLGNVNAQNAQTAQNTQTGISSVAALAYMY
jgi:hypothetical protein